MDLLIKVDASDLEAINNQLRELTRRVEQINNIDILTKDQFCKKFEIADSTFRAWRKQGLIVSSKIGNYIFVDVRKTLKL